MIGLCAAADLYDPGRGASFKTFAALVIRRRLINAVRRATLERHLILTDARRDVLDVDQDYASVVDLIPGGRDPLDILLERERISALAAKIEALSPLERDTVRAVAAGYPADTKQADNAYQRGKARLRAAA